MSRKKIIIIAIVAVVLVSAVVWYFLSKQKDKIKTTSVTKVEVIPEKAAFIGDQMVAYRPETLEELTATPLTPSRTV